MEDGPTYGFDTLQISLISLNLDKKNTEKNLLSIFYAQHKRCLASALLRIAYHIGIAKH